MTILPDVIIMENVISIHTLLAEGDTKRIKYWGGKTIISIHTLLAEGDGAIVNCDHDAIDFNPHPPRGG